MNKFPWWLILLIMVVTLACEITIPQQAYDTTTPEPTSVPTRKPEKSTTIPISTATPGSILAGDFSDMEDVLVSLYEIAGPGVVSIQTLTQLGGGLGSGFVYDKDGHIVTNYHVIEGAEDLEIDFPSGLKLRGKVIGTDLDSDQAVIKVDASPEMLFHLPLGDSDQ